MISSATVGRWGRPRAPWRAGGGARGRFSILIFVPLFPNNSAGAIRTCAGIDRSIASYFIPHGIGIRPHVALACKNANAECRSGRRPGAAPRGRVRVRRRRVRRRAHVGPYGASNHAERGSCAVHVTAAVDLLWTGTQCPLSLHPSSGVDAWEGAGRQGLLTRSGFFVSPHLKRRRALCTRTHVWVCCRAYCIRRGSDNIALSASARGVRRSGHCGDPAAAHSAARPQRQRPGSKASSAPRGRQHPTRPRAWVPDCVASRTCAAASGAGAGPLHARLAPHSRRHASARLVAARLSLVSARLSLRSRVIMSSHAPSLSRAVIHRPCTPPWQLSSTCLGSSSKSSHPIPIHPCVRSSALPPPAPFAAQGCCSQTRQLP